MKIFAYHSDCDGEIIPIESKFVLEAFKRVEPEIFDNLKKKIMNGIENVMIFGLKS